jgi:hypothetical protein
MVEREAFEAEPLGPPRKFLAEIPGIPRFCECEILAPPRSGRENQRVIRQTYEREIDVDPLGDASSNPKVPLDALNNFLWQTGERCRRHHAPPTAAVLISPLAVMPIGLA